MSVESVWQNAATLMGQTGEEVVLYTDPQTPLQLVFSRIYPDALELALALMDWSFARARFTPTDITATHTPPPEWTYSWSLPADMVEMRGFSIERPPRKVARIPFEISLSVDGTTEVLWTAADPFVGGDEHLIYTKRVTDPAKWPRRFEIALQAMLASEATFAMTRDRNAADKLFEGATRKALATTKIESEASHYGSPISSIEAARR